VDAEDALTMGRRVRQVRYTWGKSLRVIAELAGISKSHLSRIERGERALDSRSEVVALANALQIAPSDLTSMPVPAPGNGGTDVALEAVRVALMAVNHGHPGGDVLPVHVLRERVDALIGTSSVEDQQLTGQELPILRA
jgi:transcriptional regulator with XRE-family HTH domain